MRVSAKSGFDTQKRDRECQLGLNERTSGARCYWVMVRYFSTVR